MKFKPYITCNLVWSLKFLFFLCGKFLQRGNKKKREKGNILYMGAYSQEKKVHHSRNCFAKN